MNRMEDIYYFKLFKNIPYELTRYCVLFVILLLLNKLHCKPRLNNLSYRPVRIYSDTRYRALF